jgi:nucleoside-diphosphate-sugar epimerase
MIIIMARILITGASGFIGAHLARAALAGPHQEVTCLVRHGSCTDSLRSLDVRLAYGDVTERDSLLAAVRGHDIVFHLAGCLRAFHLEQLYRVNEEGVHNVAWACAQQTTPPRLVLASSLAAAGPSLDQRPQTELDPAAPVSHYGQSKQAGERAAREFANRVPITIIRPPFVFGEGDPATRKIFRHVARRGIHLVPSWRNHAISLIHADDLANLFLLAAERGKRLAPVATDPATAAQGCYFAAAERDLEYAELGRMIGTALGRRRTLILHTGPAIVWTVATLFTVLARLRGQPTYFDVDKAREARAGCWTCSAGAATRELGFATAAPLAQRLRQTALWYREHGWI